MEPATIKIIVDYGVLGLACVLLWKALQAKEAKLSKAIETAEKKCEADKAELIARCQHLDDYCRDTLAPLADKCAIALTRICDHLDDETRRNAVLDPRDHR